MSEFQVKGTIKTILPVETGVAKSTGNAWKKVNFVVGNNEGYEGKEQLFCFQIFSEKSVDNFIKFNKVGQQVEVKFSIQTNEYNGNYYTSLSAYRVESGERVEQAHQTPVMNGDMANQFNEDSEGDNLPF
uniref:DUF3127 domain-containing protein n=1 Tax=Yoonia sp. TaxID=2212373 RepID=UPI00404742D3